MFDLFGLFQSGTMKEKELVAVVNGKVVPLEEVPDEAFAKRKLGDGVAIYPDDDVIVSPADGKIAMLFPSMHAFGMVLSNGIELLVHIGINTVSLKGNGFERFVNKNDIVKAGDPIIKINREFLKQEGYCPVIMLIVTDPHGCSFEFVQPGEIVTVKSIVASFQ